MASNLEVFPSHLSPTTSSKPRRRSPRYGKPSAAIRSKQAKPYEAALAYAIANERYLGLEFVFITIWLGGTIYADAHNYESVIAHKLELLRKWLWQRGVPFYPFWVREIGDTKGEHLHLLLHCPKQLLHCPKGFRAYVRDTFPKRAPGALKIEARKYHQACEGCDEIRDWKHLAGRYFLKGSTNIVRERNGINKCASALPEIYSQDQGTIRGKRLGYPRPFAKSARGRT